MNPSEVNVFDCFVFVVPGHILGQVRWKMKLLDDKLGSL